MVHGSRLNLFTIDNAFDWRLVMTTISRDISTKLGILIQKYRADRPDEWTMDEFTREAEVMGDKIAELEAQLKTAKRDGILEAIRHIKNLSGQPLTEHGVVHMLTRYANSLTGEE